jgi:hypothetical protein
MSKSNTILKEHQETSVNSHGHLNLKNFSPQEIQAHPRMWMLTHLCQPTPLYGAYKMYKNSDGSEALGWRFLKNPLTFRVLNSHLRHTRTIGTLGRWYPEFGILDFDDKPLKYVQDVCDTLELNTDQRWISTSASPNSWHVYFKPRKSGHTVTLKYMQRCMQGMMMNRGFKRYEIELYPQPSRIIRLPFSPFTRHIDEGAYESSVGWEQGVQALQQLEEYELPTKAYLLEESEVPLIDLPSEYTRADNDGSWMKEGIEYLNLGLSSYGQRLHAIRRIAYVFWYNNYEPSIAIEMLDTWLKTKHNGKSRDFNDNPRLSLQKNAEVVRWTYAHFARRGRIPLVPHLLDRGVMCKETLEDIAGLSRGNLPQMRFTSGLFSYLGAKHHDNAAGVSVHSDRLIEWSSKTN